MQWFYVARSPGLGHMCYLFNVSPYNLFERVLHDMPRLSEMSSDTMLVCV